MNPLVPKDWPQFFTSSVNAFQPLLQHDHNKEMIIESLRFLVRSHRAKIFGFVIMSTHLHLIWQALGEHTLQKVAHSFAKFTASKLLADLRIRNRELSFKSEMGDRRFNIWQRDPMCVELFSRKHFMQKLDYIHNNPVNAGICPVPEDYKYSSAGFYYSGDQSFDFLEHFDRL